MGEKMDWSRNRLTDNDLVVRLQGLTTVAQRNIQVLLMFNNQLTKSPNFNCLPFLTELNLGKNKITAIDATCIPQNVIILSLKYNQITDLLDMTSLSRLEKLDLAGNNIAYLDGRNLPKGLKLLDLNGNKIKNIDNIDEITGLETLHLYHNQISVLKALPENLQTVSLLGNPLRELHYRCFSSERLYQRLMLRNKKVICPEDVALSETQVQALQSPPPSVLKAGYPAVRKHFAATGLKMKDLNLKENQHKEKPGPLVGCSKEFAHEINLSQCFGDVTMFLPVVGKAVCSLVWQSTKGSGRGTGFVLGSLQSSLPADNKRYFAILTCYHLLELGLANAVTEPKSTKVATFHFYKDASSRPQAITLDILSVIVDNKDLDYAMLCLDNSDDLCRIFTYENFIGPFIHNRDDAPEHLSTLTLVGYPGAEVKKVDSSVLIYSKGHIEKEGKLRFPITKEDSKMLFYSCSIGKDLTIGLSLRILNIME